MLLITLLALIAFSALLGIAYVVYRNVAEQVTVVPQKSLPQAVMATATEKKLSGTFTEIDVVHKGRGQAVVYQTLDGPVLRFENFTVTPGPDLFVYLSKEKDFVTTKDLGSYVSLGKLQSTKGEQIYSLPSDFSQYSTVIIWCRAFSTLFSYAELR